MLQYLVILLDDTSVAYCHADNPLTERNLMPLDTLRRAILFGMKENLMIQYVLPEYELPEEYYVVMETIDNVKILGGGWRGGGSDTIAVGIETRKSRTRQIVDEPSASRETDVFVYDHVPEQIEAQNIVIRLPFEELMAKRYDIAMLLGAQRTTSAKRRINIVVTDVEKFTDEQIDKYRKALSEWAMVIAVGYNDADKDKSMNNVADEPSASHGGGWRGGGSDIIAVGIETRKSRTRQIADEPYASQVPQVNILTDRLRLKEMHNCNAGVNNITVAPNGRFYLCPAFYYDERMGINNRLNHHKPQHDYSVGDIDAGLQIPNQQLLRLDHAPLCRICDAYHCKRCVWLNQRLTWDANTPSHQQCVLAHLERNASRELQRMLFATHEDGCVPNAADEPSASRVKTNVADEPSASRVIPNEIKEITYLDPFDVREEF